MCSLFHFTALNRQKNIQHYTFSIIRFYVVILKYLFTSSVRYVILILELGFLKRFSHFFFQFFLSFSLIKGYTLKILQSTIYILLWTHICSNCVDNISLKDSALLQYNLCGNYLDFVVIVAFKICGFFHTYHIYSISRSALFIHFMSCTVKS